MIKKNILIIFSLILLIFNTNSNSLENTIVIKIEDQIITSLDVNDEYRYLIALNPGLKNSSKEDVMKLSKRSILQEKIKKIEIDKNFKNPEIPQKFLEQILKNVIQELAYLV